MKIVIAVTLTATEGTEPGMVSEAVCEALGDYLDNAADGSPVDEAEIELSLVSPLAFVKRAYIEHTGGNCRADVLCLEQGPVLVIADEEAALYPSVEAWNEGPHEDRPSMSLLAAAKPAVVCRVHGRQELTDEQYLDQLNDPDSVWQCPECGMPSGFDDSSMP